VFFAVVLVGIQACSRTKTAPASDSKVASPAAMAGQPSAPPAAATAVAAQPSDQTGQQPSDPGHPSSGPLSKSVAKDTNISVTLNETLDSEMVFAANFVMGTISSDVKGVDGRVAIPVGSRAVIRLGVSGRSGENSFLFLSLQSLLVDGVEYRLSNEKQVGPPLVLTENATRGQGHRSVHVLQGDILNFKLNRDLDLSERSAARSQK
jgi:hypothetical protein